MLLAAAMLYVEKINYDEQQYVAEVKEIDKRIADIYNTEKENLYSVDKIKDYLDDLPTNQYSVDKIKDYLDHLPTESPNVPEVSSPHFKEVGTVPERINSPLHDIIRESFYDDDDDDDVYYKTEARYCYHVALFGGILGLVACFLSMYQSRRDIIDEGDVQRL